MHEIKAQLLEIQDRIKRAEFYFREGDMVSKITALEDKTTAPNFWDNPKEAGRISQELSLLKETVQNWEKMEKDCQDLIDLCDIIDEEKETDERQNIIEAAEELAKDLKKSELKLFLNEKYDPNDAIISIHSGTGGLDAKDFAQMLLRMYTRYAEKQKFKVDTINISYDEEAGIKSATVEIQGPYAYGYLKTEMGVHRLIRLSPFNAGNTRETSFALVEVIPKLGEEEEINIKTDDLKIDTYRSSGPGGQNVNKTDTAVRITHIPTGIVVACQSERSQLQNKERAMNLLKGKLAHRMLEQRAKTIEELKGELKDVSWGNQIRSYTLHPYKLVKDHRTGYESSHVEEVLNGETLDEFIEYSLEKQTRLRNP